MLEHRSLADIAGVQAGWLNAKHHFALGSYGNPAHRPAGKLYVWNDDSIPPHAGFPLHAHADVEIITYVREGAITHKDDLGNQGITRAGDVQVMSAGTGIRHAEHNDEDVTTRIFAGVLPWVGRKTGRNAMADFMRDQRAMTEPLAFDVEDVLASEERAVIVGRLRARIKVTGKITATQFALVLTIADDIVTRFQMLEDSYDVSRAARV